MNTMDIVKGISKAIKGQYENAEIYAEEIKQGMIYPSFVIYSVSVTSERYPSGRYHRVNPFVIHYFPKDKIKTQNECEDVAESLYWILEYIFLPDDDIPLRGVEMHHNIDDGVLHFFVNFNTFLQKNEDKTPMEIYSETHKVRR